jgi:hypothetical protein
MNKRVMLCLATVIFMAAVCLAAGQTTQTASNDATVTGGGNTVSQSNTQNAGGSGHVFQDASNSANVGGSGNTVDQSNAQSAFGGGSVTQRASNKANVGGSGNTVDQRNRQNAFGSGPISQSASNTANVGGFGNRVGQSNVQNAGTQAMMIIRPTSVLEQRIWDTSYNGWTIGPTNVYVQDTLDAQIYNDRDQYLRQHELYPDGRDVVQDLGYYPAGPVNFQFGADVVGEHKLRAEGSLSGLSPDIITIEVLPYYQPLMGGYGGTSQFASNNANVGGFGNRVGQSNTQNAFGSGASQTASNTADVFGSGNAVDQSNAQSAFGSGASQSASNSADVSGNSNSVSQSNTQNA